MVMNNTHTTTGEASRPTIHIGVGNPYSCEFMGGGTDQEKTKTIFLRLSDHVSIFGLSMTCEIADE